MKLIFKGIKLLLEGQIYILSLVQDIKQNQTGSHYSWDSESDWHRKIQFYIKELEKEDSE